MNNNTTAQQSETGSYQTIFINSGRSALAVGLFFSVVAIGAVILEIVNISKGDEGFLFLLSACITLVLVVGLTVMGYRLKKEIDLRKGNILLIGTLIVSGVLLVLTLIGKVWLSAIIFTVLVAYLSWAKNKLRKHTV